MCFYAKICFWEKKLKFSFWVISYLNFSLKIEYWRLEFTSKAQFLAGHTRFVVVDQNRSRDMNIRQDCFQNEG